MSLVPIYIDGRRFEAEEGKNLLEVGLSLGFDIPYFCWHPAMGSVGACRQCAVKQYWEDDTTQIVMACMTTIRKELRCDVHDEEAVLFRRSVIEMLMASHPHDCPVCDEGGECHLQDMTVMTGHTYRRYLFKKRTYRNQDLGPFVTHEMNRCIQCYRCTRFYNDYAGGRDFAPQRLRNNVYFGRREPGTLENEFSGNLVEVCPVGVFDDKTLAQTYTRKWDLQTAPAVCVHCARGCNTIVGERYGELRRVLNRFNDEVNGYFLCDRGRYGYQFVNGPGRIREVILRTTPVAAPGRPQAETAPELEAAVRADTAPEPAGETASAALPATDLREPFARRSVTAGARLSGTAPAAAAVAEGGSPPRTGAPAWDTSSGLPPEAIHPATPGRLRQVPASASSVSAEPERLAGEDATLLLDEIARRLSETAAPVGIGSPRASLEANYMLRRLVGPQNFYLGFSDEERDLVDLIVALHEDAGVHSPSTCEIDTADLAVVIGEDVTSTAPMLAFSLRKWLRLRPTDVERDLHILPWNDAGVGDVKRYEPSVLWSATPYVTRLDPAAAGVLHAPPQDIARATLAVAHAYDDGVPAPADLSERAGAWVETLLYALMDARRPVVVSGTGCGSADVVLAAAALARTLPGCLGLSLVVPEANSMGLALLGGGRLSDAFAAARDGARPVIVLENDLYRRAGNYQVDSMLSSSPLSVVIDHTVTRTSERAAVVLPAATYAEASGTYVSHEGRAQRSYAAMAPRGQVRESWRWLSLMAARAGDAAGLWRSVDDVLRAMAAELPRLAPAADAAPPASYRVDGMRVARQAGRYSGRTTMHAPAEMTEPRPVEDADSPLAYSMEGADEPVPPSLMARVWAPGWNSVQALNKFQEEVGGPLRGDDPGRLLFGPAPAPVADATAGGRAQGERRHGGPGTSPATARTSVPSRGDPFARLRLPDAFERVEGEWLVVPLHEIFGGEELSALGPAVASRAPAPYIALGEEDAQWFLSRGEGSARLDWGGYSANLPVRVVKGLLPGVAGLPVDLPGTAGVAPPFRAALWPAGARPEA